MPGVRSIDKKAADNQLQESLRGMGHSTDRTVKSFLILSVLLFTSADCCAMSSSPLHSKQEEYCVVSLLHSFGKVAAASYFCIGSQS